MAGDWIALRLDIHDDPAVVAIASRLDISPDCVVGKLTRLWSWANRHLQTGVAKGVTSNWIDQYVHATGFASAMIESGWLQDRSGAIHFPKFDVWNSASAKRRLLKTRQKHKERIEKPVAILSSSHDDKMATRGEERRGEKRKEEVGGGETDRPTVSASPFLPGGTPQGLAETAASAYQSRRYGTPNPRAAYYAVLLQEVVDVLEAVTDKQAAIDLFLQTCKDSPLPKDASFSDLAKSCGLKKHKAKTVDRPSQQFKDYTAERLAASMTTSH